MRLSASRRILLMSTSTVEMQGEKLGDFKDAIKDYNTAIRLGTIMLMSTSIEGMRKMI